MRAWRGRLKRYRRLVVWTAAVGGVCAATDWPFGEVLGVDWETHPLWAGVITGGLLLVAGYFGVETFLRERDASRWELVANVAFKAVGLSAGLLRDGMDRLIGADAHLIVRPQPLTEGVVNGVTERRRKLGVDGDHSQDREARLADLVEDREWAFLAVEGLDQLKWQHRDTLASWAPLMLANERLARDFGRLAELNEMVSNLQEPLRRRAGIDARGECQTDDDSALTRMITERWDAIVTRTVLLHEDFMRAAGDRTWTHVAARAHLSKAGRDELEQRDLETHSGPEAAKPSGAGGVMVQPRPSL